MNPTEERIGDPPEPAGEPGEEYRRVRELLLGGEQRQLNFLHHRLQEIQHLQKQLDERCQGLHANEIELARRLSTIVQRGDEFVEKNLAAALQRRAAGNEQSRNELVRALQGPVEASLRQSISEDPVRLGETLGPAVSTEVNRGLWEIFRESGLQKLIRFRADGSTKLAWPIAIMISVVLIALTGWLVISIKENLGLERAAAVLRAEPGIVVSAAGNPVLGKPQITGLRDPLAPAAEKILSSAGLRPENFTIDLQPFQSVDTAYAHQREQDRIRDLEDLRRKMLEAIGGLTAAHESVRERDLETFTRALFALQFPEVADQVTLEFKEDRWLLSGAIEEPLYSRLMVRASDMVLTGEIDTSGLRNATALRIEELRAEIAAARLTYLTEGLDLNEESIARREGLVGLIRELDSESARLGRLPASFVVHAFPEVGGTDLNETLLPRRIEATESFLMEQAGIPVERILPGVVETGAPPGEDGVFVEVIDPEN